MDIDAFIDDSSVVRQRVAEMWAEPEGVEVAGKAGKVALALPTRADFFLDKSPEVEKWGAILQRPRRK